MFAGTDHPFFPPLSTKGVEANEQEWQSVSSNKAAIKEAFSGNPDAASGILGGNAKKILRLEKNAI
jgi:hypothetical protein